MPSPNRTLASPVFSCSETLYFCCLNTNSLLPRSSTSHTRLCGVTYCIHIDRMTNERTNLSRRDREQGTSCKRVIVSPSSIADATRRSTERHGRYDVFTSYAMKISREDVAVL